MKATAAHDATAYCAEMLRRQDYDRYLTCLSAPAAARDALFALYAFNLEVAKTAEIVSESTIGQIRLQWWRDAIARIYGGQDSAHLVVDAMAAAVSRHDLSRAHFERLIDAREADLSPEAPAHLAALEDYARDTCATLLWLALEILGVESKAGEHVHRAAESVGIAWALTGLLRAVPFHARQGRLLLPADMVRETGLKVSELFELERSSALEDISRRVAKRARWHLASARKHRRDIPSAALPALRLAKLADSHLATLHRAGYDPFDPRVQRPVAGAAWRLAWAGLLRQY